MSVESEGCLHGKVHKHKSTAMWLQWERTGLSSNTMRIFCSRAKKKIEIVLYFVFCTLYSNLIDKSVYRLLVLASSDNNKMKLNHILWDVDCLYHVSIRKQSHNCWTFSASLMLCCESNCFFFGIYTSF